MRTTSGAWVRRARLAAAEGMPIPTKHTVPFFRRRAASMVMISLGVYAASGIGRVPPGRRDAGRLEKFLVVFRAEDVLLHPCEERVAVARYRVPRLAERVVAAV